MPPPPNPATSPAAYKPGIGSSFACSTRPVRSVFSPPSILRVRMESRTAIKGPAAGSSRRNRVNGKNAARIHELRTGNGKLPDRAAAEDGHDVPRFDVPHIRAEVPRREDV